MGTTADKLQYLIDAKSSISAAIEAKGGTVPQELSGYGAAIEALPSGGGDPEKLTYVLYEDNTISSYLLEGVIRGESISHPCPEFQNGKLVQLGNAVTEIGQFAFFGISTITTVTIPESVLRIGGGYGAGRTRGAFQNCAGLSSITIPDSVTSIGIGAFRNCSGLTSVTIGNGVTSIGNAAFNGCSGLTSITIPDSVTSIGSDAFSDCSGLTSISIPNRVTSIGQFAFYHCSGLTSVTIPDSVTSIGTSMFSNCTGLTSITIGNSVTNIGNNAFGNCSNCLIYDFSNHTSVPTLANVNAFADTNANKKIIVPDALYDSWKAANNWNSSTNGIVDAITKASEA